MFSKVLIANRGEIAVRIIRACREMGVRSVAVFSEADRRAPHVLEADEAYCIGPAPSAESYLRGDVIVEVALACGAEAVHPGYGFLAERASFSKQVFDAGLAFIGPRPETIESMGDKTQARQRMQAAGVPIVPGIVDAIEDPNDALAIAAEMRDAGMEVIYQGRFNLPPAVIEAAIQEDVDVIGISAHSWEYLHFLQELFDGLNAAGADIPVIGLVGPLNRDHPQRLFVEAHAAGGQLLAAQGGLEDAGSFGDALRRGRSLCYLADHPVV
mgnify:CR=1 FL=1